MQDEVLRSQAPGRVLLQLCFSEFYEDALLTVCVNCSFEKEFDGVQDVFELQVRSICLGHTPGDDGGPLLMQYRAVSRLLCRLHSCMPNGTVLTCYYLYSAT